MMMVLFAICISLARGTEVNDPLYDTEAKYLCRYTAFRQNFILEFHQQEELPRGRTPQVKREDGECRGEWVMSLRHGNAYPEITSCSAETRCGHRKGSHRTSFALGYNDPLLTFSLVRMPRRVQDAVTWPR